ncbi:MAG: TIGR03915 family putative DNA repair protein [Oscillospiraceae bacterium]
MPDGTTVMYRYDGSFDGLMCCIFEAFSQKEQPAEYRTEDAPTLYPVREIETDPGHAARVRASIPRRLGERGWELVWHGFLYGGTGKEAAIERFLRIGYPLGRQAPFTLSDPAVAALHKMALAVEKEAHLMTGFVRFSEHGGMLASVIEPKHFILPLMSAHFCERFCEEPFVIHDASHGAALVYHPYQARLLAVEGVEPDSPEESELEFRRLWRQYYHSTGIAERENPRGRMTHMPKRFWSRLTELTDEPKGAHTGSGDVADTLKNLSARPAGTQKSS